MPDYDLAAGFQTLIRTQEAVASEIRGLRQTITASMDMAQKFGQDPGGPAGSRGAASPSNPTVPNPTAGQTQAAGGGQTTFEGLRAAAAGLMMNRAAQGMRAAQPSSGPFAPGGRYGGGQGGWTPPGGGTGGSGGSGGSGGGAPAGAGGGAVPPQGPPAGATVSGGDSPYGGAVGGWALRNIPGLSLANNIMGEVRSQQDKDNYYRNIEGGTHGNAMGERMREEGYALSSMGVFSSAEARQAYKGVTRIGYTNRSDQRIGTTRAEALDYVYQGKKSRGQSVDEGLTQLEVASRSLSTSLDTLQGSMEAVSESAGKAGVNTEMARRQMISLMSAGISKGQGAGAAGFAQSVVSTNVSYGRDYATQVSSNRMYSRDMEYRAAAMSGMTAGHLRNLQRRDPVAALGVYQKVQDQSLNQAGVTPEMRQWIKDRVQREGGGDAIKNQPELANTIAGEFLDQFLDRMDPNAFTDVIGQLSGQDFGGNPEMAARYLVEQIAGNTMAAEAKKTQMSVGTTDMKARMADGSKNAGMESTLGGFLGKTQVGHGVFARHSDAVDAYATGAKKSGKRDPIIEALLANKDINATDAFGSNKSDKMHVEVQTHSGGRVMTLAQAIKEFPNEIAAGKVRFVDGDAAGKDVASFTGGKIDATRDWKSELRKDTKTGVTSKDWGVTNNTAAEGGTLRVELTPEAQKLVKVAYGDASAAGGTPPVFDLSGSPTLR